MDDWLFGQYGDHNAVLSATRGIRARASFLDTHTFIYTDRGGRSLLYVPPGLPIKTPPVAPACGFRGLSLPADFAVLAAGGAGKRSAVQIDQSGSVATTMTVSVGNPGKPVVLMLSAREPTVWSIRRSQQTTILAVLVSSTPVTIPTAENRSACGFFYVDADYLETLNPMARRFFGRDVDMVYPAHGGEVTLGEAKGTPSKWVGGSDVPVESYVDKKAPLAGEMGLDDAVRMGLLRRANIGDLNALYRKARSARVAIQATPRSTTSMA